MDFDSRSPLDDVAVCDYPVCSDEKATAASECIVFGIESFDRDRRRLDTFDKLRQEILRRGLANETHERGEEKKDKCGRKLLHLAHCDSNRNYMFFHVANQIFRH